MALCKSADCKLCEFLESKEGLETSFNRMEQQDGSQGCIR